VNHRRPPAGAPGRARLSSQIGLIGEDLLDFAVEVLRVPIQLRGQGTPIPTNDMWVAALVLQHDLCLLDRDRHFDALPQVTRM